MIQCYLEFPGQGLSSFPTAQELMECEDCQGTGMISGDYLYIDQVYCSMCDGLGYVVAVLDEVEESPNLSGAGLAHELSDFPGASGVVQQGRAG